MEEKNNIRREENKLGFLLDSLHNRMKKQILILNDGFDIPEHKQSSQNGCKSKKELRAWIREQNRIRKLEAVIV